ncbi:ABC transporter ATP-binding protein [Vibrio fluvialis]|nr:ABC transporter ATP-binding protein [Vibrio fluvialis]
MQSNQVVNIKGLVKNYQTYAKPIHKIRSLLFGSNNLGTTFTALDNINFELDKGDFLGVVGVNGSGKSTLLQIITGIIPADEGSVRLNGKVAALLELGAGFHPEFTGRDNVYFYGRILGLSTSQVDELYPSIIEFADIGDFINQPVKTYSSGMFVRLAFAVHACIEPDILIVDEALAVGDIFFRLKCYKRLEELKEAGCTIILVTHSMEDVLQHANKALLLHQGKQKFFGTPDEVVSLYYSMASGSDSKEQGLKKERSSTELVSVGKSGVKAPSGFLDSFNPIGSIGDDKVICGNIGLYKKDMKPSQVFFLGDEMHIYCYYHVASEIDTPCPGFVIRNDKGIVIHGKHCLQTNTDVPSHITTGKNVLVHHKVKLDIAPGEYVINIGFSTFDEDIFNNRNKLSLAELEQKSVRHNVVPDAITFSVTLDSTKKGYGAQPFYGVSELSSDIELVVVDED